MKFRVPVLLVWACLWSAFNLWGASPDSLEMARAESLYKSKNYPAAIELLQNLYRETDADFQRERARIKHFQGRCLYWTGKKNPGDMVNSLSPLILSIDIWERQDSLSSEEQDLLGRSYAYLYFIYRSYLPNLPGAIKARKRQLEIDRQLPDRQEDVLKAYNELGNLYQRIGDFSNAVSMYQALLSDKTIPENIRANGHANLGICYDHQQDFSAAEIQHQHALAIRQEFFPGSAAIGISYQQLMEHYLHCDSLDKSAQYLKLLVPMNRKFPEEGFGAAMLEAKAIIARKQGNLLESLDYYRQLLSELTRQNASPRILTKVYYQVGKLQLARSDTAGAENAFVSAIQMLDTLFNPQDEIPHVFDQPDPWLMESCRMLGQIHRGRSGGHCGKDLRKALTYFRMAARQVEGMRQNFDSRSGEDELTSKVYEVYEQGIDAAFELWGCTLDPMYRETAFWFSEKSKAAAMLKNISTAASFRDLGVPGHLLDSLNRLKLLAEWAGRGTTRVSLKEINEKRLKFEALLREQVPQYYSLVFEMNEVSLADIQEQLEAPQVFTQYFLGDFQFYAFHILPDTILCERSSITPEILSAFQKGFQFYSSNPEGSLGIDETVFAPYATYLREILLGSLEQEFLSAPEMIRDWLIVPDGVLGYFPFEAITLESGAHGIRFYQSRFTPSASLHFNEYATQSRNTEGKVLGLGYSFGDPASREVPFGDGTRRFNPLTFVPDEIGMLREQFQGDYYLEDSARKARIFSGDSTCAVIHFSTHSLLDPRDPMGSRILLADPSREEDALFAYELYSMRLNHEMAVLSFCEAGIGDDLRGEGISSLARGFAFAGCPATVYSMWNLEDLSALEIMTGFYQYLAKGHSKSAALRQAKLDFLDQNPQRKHPFYWACLTVSGKDAPVRVRPVAASLGWTGILTIALSFALLITLYLFRLRKGRATA